MFRKAERSGKVAKPARAKAAKAGNARPRRIRLGERWRGWRRHHSQSAADSLAKVLQQPVSSCMTWLVIGIAIALPTGLWVVLDNVAELADRLDRPAQLSIFLQPGESAESAQSLGVSLAQRMQIESVEFVDRDVALAEFAERAGMEQLVSGLETNPLPHLLLVVPAPASPQALDVLRGELQALPEVQEALLDTVWLQRLQSLMTLGRRGVQILAALLLAAVVLVLGNTIRLAIESRRDEIVIVKLVGGTDAFVRRPLLYTGLWFGVGGGVVGALLVTAGTVLLTSPVNALSAAYQSSFSLRGLGLVNSLQLVLLGAMLGLAGAWLAVARHLKAIEPR